jgi:hypothetical protein
MKNQHILYVVLAVTIVLLMALAYDSATSKQEGFANQRNGCPVALKPSTVIYGKQSTKVCCYGKVENGKCIGDGMDSNSGNSCSIGKKSGDLPECREFINNIKNDVKQFFCPKSMQNMFFMKDVIGCTDGPLNTAEDGPLHPSSKQCTINIKNMQNFDKTNPNSCFLQGRLEELECIGSKCNKFIRTSPNNTHVLGMDFVSPDGIPVTCYDNFSDELTANGMNHWKSSDVAKVHPMDCAVAKKLYVDKTMSPADVKLLP